jgi:hypothetical protein
LFIRHSFFGEKKKFSACVFWSVPDEGVDLDGVNVVQLLKSSLDLSLVRLDVHDEHQGVVLLDLLHGALRVQGIEDDLVGVEARKVRDGLAGVLGGPGQLKSLGAVEGGGGADLASLVRLDVSKNILAWGVPSHLNVRR